MARSTLIGEFWAFLRVRKKWWLLPIVIVMLLVGSLLVFAQGSALAPGASQHVREHAQGISPKGLVFPWAPDQNGPGRAS